MKTDHEEQQDERIETLERELKELKAHLRRLWEQTDMEFGHGKYTGPEVL